MVFKFSPKILILSVLITGCATTNQPKPAEQSTETKTTAISDVQKSDATAENTQPEKVFPATKTSEITLVFAGDVMAHTVNYKPGNFKRIWRDIEPLVKESDLAFANIEAPVADNIDWNTYPQFNMHQEYVEEAIKIGFNVFSLTNNHTNDQYLEGMKATRNYFENRQGVWAAGLREKSNAPLTYKLIEKKDWKILFVAITEILNRNDYSSYIDYYPSTEKKRTEFKESLRKLKEENPCDLLVVSIHTDEPEYILTVTENHKKYFRELINECGADIIWANHPHVVKEWEKITADNGKDAFIMYANGNTISGQRTNPRFDAPETARDNTGDGLIMKLKLSKTESEKPKIISGEPFFITTYINPNWQYVVKFLDDDFINALDKADLFNWSKYINDRKNIMNRIKEKSKWQ